MVKKILRFSLYLLVSLGCLLLAFEVAYRYQCLDFYGPELRAFNSQAELRDHSRKTLLIMGDSFSAGLDTWVDYLKPKLPAYHIISAAIPATGIFESLVTAPRRFQEFQPTVFIYQIFVGNDLQDLRRPLNWRTMGLARYVYCFSCSHLGLRSLTFANYRLAQLLSTPGAAPGSTASLEDQRFSPASYNPLSVRIYYQAEPDNLDNTVRARGDRGRDLETLIVEVKKLFAYCAPDCRKYLVVVPDAAQVNDFYLHNMEQLGARFARAEDLHQVDYPFLARLRQGLAGEPIAILNPLPLLQADEARGWRLYYANDIHLNRTGQALLGQYVLERLQADGLASR